MGPLPIAIGVAVALFVAMLVMLEIGHRLGNRLERLDVAGAHAGTGAVEGAVFALLGLLVAFTFSGAATRFDARRQLVVEEANAIGTAYLRLNLAPPAAQPGLRDLFRRYVDARIATFRAVPDLTAAHAEHARALALHGEIWSRADAACREAAGSPCAMLLLPAVNALIDITTTRSLAIETHPPPAVFVLLFGLGLACSLLAGYSLSSGTRRKWSHSVVFAAVTALTVYVILDFEYPRFGLMRVDAVDHFLVDVRAGME